MVADGGARASSCSGHGSCNDDPDPYDGVFLGCSCTGEFTGDRCNIERKACPENQKYIVSARACRAFNASFSERRRPGRLQPKEYIDPTAEHIFTVGDTIRIRAKELNTAETRVSFGSISSITYKLAEGAPAGFFVSSSTGEILGHIDPSQAELHNGRFNVTLQAVDASGLTAHVETMQFTVRPKQPDVTEPDVTVPILTSVVCVLIVVAVAYMHRARQLKRRAHDFAAQLEEMRANGELSDEISSSCIPREIKRSHIVMTDQIGRGAFGSVWKGLLDEGAVGGVPGYLVAVKTTNKNDFEGSAELLREAALMALVERHPNVVSLVGVVTSGTPLLLLITFCEHGALSSCLKRKTVIPFGSKSRLSICLDVAQGMHHLATSNFVHRDLAARNVLLDSLWTGKVADFGLSRLIAVGASGAEGAEMYYKSVRSSFAVRWTAPDTMTT